MSASVLYMSMSLDGYIAAPNDHRRLFDVLPARVELDIVGCSTHRRPAPGPQSAKIA